MIHDINIGINKGEIVTLIGPNGSGKSTILKSITRQLKWIAGNVFYDDTSLLQLSYKEMASKMAVVLTERIKNGVYDLSRCSSKWDVIHIPAVRNLTAKDEKIVEEAMETVHALELGKL